MNWQDLFTPQLCSRLSLALLHSLWIVAVIVLAVAAIDYGLRRHAVRIRYVVMTMGLCLSFCVLPAVLVLYGDADTAPAPIPVPTAAATAAQNDRQPAESTSTVIPATTPVAQLIANPTLEPRTAEGLSFNRWSQIFVLVYTLGVLLMLARFLRGVVAARRLCGRAEAIESGPLYELLQRAADSWSMRIVPRLARAEEIIVPKVVGLLRPTILLPMSAGTGLTTDELAMILAHELAHIRRHDMWINLLQRLAETLYFFNPAIWYLSRRISTLREFCCDEAVCTTLQDAQQQSRTRYATALLRVAELSRRRSPTAELATLAASGRSPSELRRRVARLFGEPLREPFPLSRWTALVPMIVVIGLLVAPAAWQSEDGTAAAQSGETGKDKLELKKRKKEPKPKPDSTPTKTTKSDPPQKQPKPKQDKLPITVAGRATDGTGKAIWGAKVYLLSPRTNKQPLAVVKTDEDGNFRFEDVPLPIQPARTTRGRDAGAFELFAEADGYGFAWRSLKWVYPGSKHEEEPNWYNMEKRDLPSRFGRDDPINLDLVFSREAKVRGRIIDEQGRPIADTKLALRSCDPEWDQANFNVFSSPREFESLNERALVPPRIKVRTTDAQGRFEFNKLPANCRFWIDVRPPGHPPRMIWAVTRNRANFDEKGNRVYNGDFDVVFQTPRNMKFRVVYEETGKPAHKVGVGGRVVKAGFWKTTDKNGMIEVPLPDGNYRLAISPRYQTPYLNTDVDVVVSEETAKETITLKLRPAAVLDITVRDADTGTPLEGVDVWREINSGTPNTYRNVHGYKSWEVETRLSHYTRPRSDNDGKMQVFIEPGKHCIGVGKDNFPKGYKQIDTDGREIDCKLGKPTAVEFRMRQELPSLSPTVKRKR